MKSQGFSLIELMIVIAIIGILASIAVPSYQSYIFKAKASELMGAATPAMNAVSTYVQEQGLTSASCPATGLTFTPPPATANVSTVTLSPTTCVVTVTSPAAAFGGTPLVVTFTPTVRSDSSITWACTSSDGKFTPSSCPAAAASATP